MDDRSAPREAHEAVQELLPWYATGTLDPAERALVDAHLETCAECRAELALERQLMAMPAAAVPFPDAGWAAMAVRLGEKERAPVPLRRPRRAWVRGGVRGPERRLRWLVGAQFAAILLMAGWIAASPTVRAPAYRALGSGGAPPAGNVLAMFRPGTTEAELRRLLTGSEARLVDGPTSAGAYVLAVPDEEAAVARLRRDPAVTMAEPIGGPPQP